MEKVAFEDLNKQQRAVCEHLDGPILVLGGPGSGKTTVVRHRYEQLVKKGIDPENILLTTFSRDAVKELQERIDTETGDGTSIGTIHSVFYTIVKEHFDKLGYQTANLNLYQRREVEELLKEIVTERTHGKAAKSTVEDTVTFYKTNIDKFRANGMTPSDLEQAMRERDVSFQHLIGGRKVDPIQDAEEKAPSIYREFLDRMHDRNAIDYTGMQYKAYIVLQNNEEALEQYREKYQHLIVDEAQDLNFVQWQLIRLLGEEHGNVCMVGDDCQNIYAWRGSDHRYLQEFRKQFGAATFTLPVNYRSTQQILDTINDYMQHLEDVDRKTLQSANGRLPQSDGHPQITEYDTRHLERNKIVRRIRELVDGRYDADEIAILLRTRGHRGKKVKFYNEALQSMGVDAAGRRGFRFMDKKEVKYVLSVLKAHLNPDDDIVLWSVLRRLDGIGEATLEELSEAKPAGVSLYTYLSGLTPEQAPVSAEKLETLKDAINTVIELNTADNPVEYVIEEMDVDDRIEEWGGDTDTRHMNLTALKTAAGKFPNTQEGISDFFDHIANTSEEDERTGVTVTTMHGAKGKEWDVVFLPEIQQNTLPHPMNNNIEEEKRLFYVALSRARERCYISYHDTPSDFLDYLE